MPGAPDEVADPEQWRAQVAREGKKVMRFLSDRRYIANVVDGKVQFYGRGGRGE